MTRPLCSVITPTWRRHDLLMDRCVPSVVRQDYPAVEHIVVSDGPDPELAVRMRHYGADLVRFEELPEHDLQARWGHYARLRALELAKGEYVAYLDDDNAFRPDHVVRLVKMLEADPSAGFAYSLIMMNGNGASYAVGADPPYLGGIDTSAILHRRSLLDVATWRDEPWQVTVDWDLVDRWMAAGVTWAFDGEITADYYFR